MFDYVSAGALFNVLVDRHPALREPINEARYALLKWAQDDATPVPKLMASRLDSAAKGEIFCGSVERLTDVAVSPQAEHLVAYAQAREGLDPHNAHIFATCVTESCAVAGADFDLDRWRLMSEKQREDYMTPIMSAALSRIYESDAYEPNVRASLETGKVAAWDLRPTCSVRLETADMKKPAWFLTETQRPDVPGSLMAFTSRPYMNLLTVSNQMAGLVTGMGPQGPAGPMGPPGVAGPAAQSPYAIMRVSGSAPTTMSTMEEMRQQMALFEREQAGQQKQSAGASLWRRIIGP